MPWRLGAPERGEEGGEEGEEGGVGWKGWTRRTEGRRNDTGKRGVSLRAESIYIYIYGLEEEEAHRERERIISLTFCLWKIVSKASSFPTAIAFLGYTILVGGRLKEEEGGNMMVNKWGRWMG